jgi:hypothetical protein
VGVLLVENSPEDNPGVARQALDREKVYDDQPIIPGERRRISLMEGGGLRMPWDSVATIRVSREMANQILSLVDQSLEEAPGLGQEIKHRALDLERPGRVDLWPVVEKADGADDVPWHLPVDVPSPEDAAVVLANTVAEAISEMLGKGSIPS